MATLNPPTATPEVSPEDKAFIDAIVAASAMEKDAIFLDDDGYVREACNKYSDVHQIINDAITARPGHQDVPVLKEHMKHIEERVAYLMGERQGFRAPVRDHIKPIELSIFPAPAPTTSQKLASKARNFADGAAMKAVELNMKYDITGKTVTGARTLRSKASQINEEYDITGKVTGAAKSAEAKIEAVDAKYDVSGNVSRTAAQVAETAKIAGAEVATRAAAFDEEYQVTAKASEMATNAFGWFQQQAENMQAQSAARASAREEQKGL